MAPAAGSRTSLVALRTKQTCRYLSVQKRTKKVIIWSLIDSLLPVKRMPTLLAQQQPQRSVRREDVGSPSKQPLQPIQVCAGIESMCVRMQSGLCGRA